MITRRKGRPREPKLFQKMEVLLPLVVSASSSVGSEKAKVARAKARPMDGGLKRSRTSVPEGMSEEDWVSMNRQQCKELLKRNK